MESSRRTDRERDSDRDREGQDKRRHCLRRAVYIREMMELPSMPPYAASKLWPAVSGFQVDDKFIFLVVISELWTGCNCSTPYPTIPSLSPTPTSLDSFSMRSFYENRGQVATGIEAQKGGILRRENVLTSIGSCTKLCYTHISFYVVCVQVWVCGGKLIRNPRKTPAEWELYCSSAARHQCTYICTIFLCSMYFICMYSIRIRGWHQGQIHRAKGSSELLDLL